MNGDYRMACILRYTQLLDYLSASNGTVLVQYLRTILGMDVMWVMYFELSGLPPHNPAAISYTGLVDFLSRRCLSHTSTWDFERVDAVLLGIGNDPDMETDLVFSLFDDDQDGKLCRENFKQLSLFYTGSTPSLELINSVWCQITPSRYYIKKPEYMRWLVRGSGIEQHSSTSQITGPPRRSQASRLSVFERFMEHKRGPSQPRVPCNAPWNNRHQVSHSNGNRELHPLLRDYFDHQ